jgi:3,4-dihydroxy 2-butanone 4-phosphate synthase/GTP cyclohydrolase II
MMTDTEPNVSDDMNTIPELLEDLRAGKMIVLLDDEGRENEGDLVCAAEHATPETINFMAKHGRGLICLPMTPERMSELGIPPMVEHNTTSLGTDFGVSIEARHAVTTGISAADRATTIQLAAASATRAEDLVRPGHVFPLRAKRGGVLKRTGHTEASVDLCRLAGLKPMAVICEIMNDDGTMARMKDLQAFSTKHDLKISTIAHVVSHRMRTERLVRRVASPDLPTSTGKWKIHAYEYALGDQTHVALVRGDVNSDQPVLVRVHSQCLTGDVFRSTRCDCGAQLERAMELITDEGSGVVLYLRQEGRGIGLANKLRAYELQDREDMDTVEANISLGFNADHRDYGVGAQILNDLGVRQIRLMTNNMGKFIGLAGYGIEIVERVAIELPALEDNREYLRTKKNKMGHLLDGV